MKKLLLFLLLTPSAFAQEKKYKVELKVSEIQQLLYSLGQRNDVSARYYTDLAAKIDSQVQQQVLDTFKNKQP